MYWNNGNSLISSFLRAEIPLSGQPVDFVSRSVQDDCARTRIETGLRSLRTRRPGPVVGRQKVGAHARLFVDRDEKRRTLPDGNKGGRRCGRGRDRGPETGGPVCARGRIIRGLACLSFSYTVVGTWKVSLASAILCRTRHGHSIPRVVRRPHVPTFRRAAWISRESGDRMTVYLRVSIERRRWPSVTPLYAFYRGRLHHQRESFSRGLAIAFSGIPCAIQPGVRRSSRKSHIFAEARN